MRLIDADKLLRKQYEIYVPEDPEAWFSQAFTHKVVSIEDIKKAPTIEAEPVKHGRWVKDGDFLICLECESEINIKNSLGVENHKNYCPNCGAKMDGGGDEN